MKRTSWYCIGFGILMFGISYGFYAIVPAWIIPQNIFFFFGMIGLLGAVIDIFKNL